MSIALVSALPEIRSQEDRAEKANEQQEMDTLHNAYRDNPDQ